MANGNPFLIDQGNPLQGLGQLGAAYFQKQRQDEQAAAQQQSTQGAFQLLGDAEREQDPVKKRQMFIQAFQMNPEMVSGYVDTLKKQQEAGQVGAEKPITEYQKEQVDIKKAALEMRRIENETRKLEQRLSKENNELKREELQLKIDERKNRITQSKKDIEEGYISDLSTIDNTLNTISQLKEGEGLEAAVGTSSLLPTIAGSEAANFESRLEQLKSQQFLNEVGRLKGMGALSENEGKKLAAAASALELSMSEDAFKKELDYIESTMQGARNKIARKIPKSNETTESGSKTVKWGDY